MRERFSTAIYSDYAVERPFAVENRSHRKPRTYVQGV